MQKDQANMAEKYRAPPVHNLLRDYPSFELLWYDIESHVRLIIEGLIDPVLIRVTEYENDIYSIHP